jgi:hypothetical protein
MRYLFFFSILTFFLMTSNGLNGQINPKAGQFAVQAEYLCWHPLFDQSFFVFDQAAGAGSLPVGHRHNNPTRWASGLRLEGIYAFTNCDNEFGFRWTHFNSSFYKSFNKPAGFLIPTQGHAFFAHTDNTFAKSSIHLNFDSAEFFFWKFSLSKSPHCFVKGGLNYSYINFLEHLFYFESPVDRFSTIKERNYCWYVGPAVCLDFSYSLTSLLPLKCKLPIYLHGDLRGALVVSRSKGSFFEIDQETVFHGVSNDAHNDPVYRLVPLWDFRLGFSYNITCKDVGFSLEAGYEVLSYHQALQTTVFPNGSTDPSVFELSGQLSFDIFSNLDFHGPYVALGISY